MKIILGIIQWTLIVVSVAGTIALFGSLLYMFFKKDRT